jgi:hypothetical protein
MLRSAESYLYLHLVKRNGYLDYFNSYFSYIQEESKFQ